MFAKYDLIVVGAITQDATISAAQIWVLKFY